MEGIMKVLDFKGFDDYQIKLHVWDDVVSPKAVIQLSHGMAEHLLRYDDFAKFLNRNGYIVLGEDHRVHGKTAVGKLGIVEDWDCFSATVQDLALITDYAIKEYNLPVILFGHSYGSFLSQLYIQLFSDKIKGVVLSGTALQAPFLSKVVSGLAGLQIAFCGKEKPAKMITKIAFGPFDKQFKDEATKNSWLSRDPELVKKYNEDPESGFTCSLGFFKSMGKNMKSMYKKENIDKIRKDLPIFVVCGSSDPVGGNGKTVLQLIELYKRNGIQDVKCKLYENARHEVLNEINKNEVYADILSFINSIVK